MCVCVCVRVCVCVCVCVREREREWIETRGRERKNAGLNKPVSASTSKAMLDMPAQRFMIHVTMANICTPAPVALETSEKYIRPNLNIRAHSSHFRSNFRSRRRTDETSDEYSLCRTSLLSCVRPPMPEGREARTLRARLQTSMSDERMPQLQR